MLWLLALLLVLVWLFGLVGGYSAGVWTWAFLVLAALVLVLAIVGRRRQA